MCKYVDNVRVSEPQQQQGEDVWENQPVGKGGYQWLGGGGGVRVKPFFAGRATGGGQTKANNYIWM